VSSDGQGFIPADPGRDRPPFGYGPAKTNQRYTGLIGPFYERLDDENRRWRGIRIAQRHTNGAGIVHGGFLVTLADSLLGHAIGHATQALPLTMRLSSDFVQAVKLDDWLEGFAALDGVQDDSAYAHAALYVSGHLVLRSSAVFKLMRRHRPVEPNR
jgi:acyl-coenzyme A thioesterase PaaI-like protein